MSWYKKTKVDWNPYIQASGGMGRALGALGEKMVDMGKFNAQQKQQKLFHDDKIGIENKKIKQADSHFTKTLDWQKYIDEEDRDYRAEVFDWEKGKYFRDRATQKAQHDDIVGFKKLQLGETARHNKATEDATGQRLLFDKGVHKDNHGLRVKAFDQGVVNADREHQFKTGQAKDRNELDWYNATTAKQNMLINRALTDTKIKMLERDIIYQSVLNPVKAEKLKAELYKIKAETADMYPDYEYDSADLESELSAFFGNTK